MKKAFQAVDHRELAARIEETPTWHNDADFGCSIDGLRDKSYR
jgi:hypothetical protein